MSYSATIQIEDEDQGVQSSISVGGLPGLKRKEGAATQAERSYQSKTGLASKGTSSRTDTTKRGAREEALRQQKYDEIYHDILETAGWYAERRQMLRKKLHWH